MPRARGLTANASLLPDPVFLIVEFVMEEVHCCLFCGRDTRAKDEVCYCCKSGKPSKQIHSDRLGRTEKNFDIEFDEDRYDDESGPDDIYDDSEAKKRH